MSKSESSPLEAPSPSELEVLRRAVDAEKKVRRESDARLAALEARLAALTGSSPPESSSADGAAHALDRYYVAFEDRFRGGRESIKARFEVYGPQLVATTETFPGGLCLDLGCGRGEWLEILAAHGLQAVGVDTNTAMVEDCRARGLDARLGDGLTFLAEQDEASAAMVGAFHVIEHLPDFEALVDLFSAGLRVLKPGGVAIFESPNPENLTVGACSFYLDHTHRKPLHPESVGLLLEATGFVDVQVLRLVHARAMEPPFSAPPTDAPMAAELEKVFRLLNNHLLSAPDFAVVGLRPV